MSSAIGSRITGSADAACPLATFSGAGSFLSNRSIEASAVAPSVAAPVATITAAKKTVRGLAGNFMRRGFKRARPQCQVESCHLLTFGSAVTARNMRAFPFRCALLFALVSGGVAPIQAASCVWKVSGPNGGTLYLGGSIHALRKVDYPLPLAFNR